MARLLLMLIVALSVPALSCSQLGPTSPTEQPDDIVHTPGGLAYRANVHQQGVPDRWPAIEMTEVTLTGGPGAATVAYRDSIEMKAGQTRNNILHITLPGVALGDIAFDKTMTVNVDLASAPMGFSLAQGDSWHGPVPGRRTEIVVMVHASPKVGTGEHLLELAININGRYYGRLPCAVEVVE